MNKQKLLEIIANKIISLQKDKPIIVAINGIDGAGKTCFTKELKEILDSKSTDIIYASIDGFHNSKQIRYQKGKDSPEGFYKDSYNYEKLLELLINPILNTENSCKTEYYNVKKQEKVFSDSVAISNKTILIIEGIFLFRPEENAKRINKSATRMCMPEIPQELFMEAIKELIKIDSDWVPAIDGTSLYIRPYLFASEELLGVRPADEYKFMIFTIL